MKLFFADTETTGLDPEVNEIFQLAFLIEIDGTVALEKNITMRPERPEAISPEALAITGKTKDELMSYQPKKAAYQELIGVLSKFVDRYDKKDKMMWIGQNPDFDVRFLRKYFLDMGDKFFGSWWDRGPADLISLGKIMKMRGHIDPPDFKLASIAAEVGVAFKAHDALDDVRATYETWNKLISIIPTGAKAPPKKKEKTVPGEFDF